VRYIEGYVPDATFACDAVPVDEVPIVALAGDYDPQSSLHAHPGAGSVQPVPGRHP
jgi:hypothetical protein